MRSRHQWRQSIRRQFAFDLLVFGKRAGEFAAKFAKQNDAAAINDSQVEESARKALEPFERGSQGESAYQIQYDLQEIMQDMVGIVRQEGEMLRALRWP
jgi:succinate dehydrogenase / fumarate reductase flavoprotein subunit